MAAEELLVDAAEAAAKRAKQAAALAILALAVALAVLAIDNGIKRAILDEARKARELLDQAAALAQAAVAGIFVPDEEADGDAAEAGDAGAADSAGVDSGDVLVDAPGAPEAAPDDAEPGRRAAARGPNGRFARARGDG